MNKLEGNPFAYLAEGLNEKNCNARLTHLYNTRDKTSNDVDSAILDGDLDKMNSYEKKYFDICAVIDELIKFRYTHDCLLEGDPGYGL